MGRKDEYVATSPGDETNSNRADQWGLHRYFNQDIPDPVIAAASVTSSGWPVIPIWPETKRPIGSGGRQHKAIWLTTPKQVVDYGEKFAEERGRWPSWAAVLGEPNDRGLRLVVLDTDSAEAEQKLQQKFREMPEAGIWARQTLTVTTARGVHRYGTARVRTGTGKPWEEFDFKGSGYVLLPGARHPDGARYEDSSPMQARLMAEDQPPMSVFRGYSHDFAEEDWSRVMSLPTALLADLTAGIPDDAREDETGEGPARPAQHEGQALKALLSHLRQMGRKIDQRSSTWAMVSCPGPTHQHGDQHPSLSITGVEGKVLLKCFSGCETTDIMAAIGWSMSDLFDRETTPTVEAQDALSAAEETIEQPTDTTATETVGEAETGTEAADGVEVLEDADSPKPKALGGGSIKTLTRFRLWKSSELDSLPDPIEIIKGVLPAKGGPAMLAGQRGLGKSFLALDIAAAISTGAPFWNGHKVKVHGRVLYVSLESFHGMKKRRAAWQIEHGGKSLDGIIWTNTNIDLKRPVDSAELSVLVEELGDIVMVVIDSARAAGTGKEDTDEMGEFVKGVEAIANRTGVTPLVLHNTILDGSRERGSSVLPDAMETNLIIEGDPRGLRTMKHRKHKDGDEMDPMDFVFKQIPLEPDADGDPVTSGVMMHQAIPAGDDPKDHMAFDLQQEAIPTSISGTADWLHMLHDENGEQLVPPDMAIRRAWDQVKDLDRKPTQKLVRKAQELRQDGA